MHCSACERNKSFTNSTHNELHNISCYPVCMQACNGFAHSNGEVREASKELTVAVNACVTDSNGLVERHLSTLRPKQLEEYKDAFKGTSTTAGATSSSNAEHSSGSTAQASTHASSTRRRDSATGSAGATSSSKTTGDTPRGHKGGTPKGGAAKAGGGSSGGHSDAPPKRGVGGNAVDPPKTSPLLSPRTTGKPAGKTPRGGT
jgi:hypothetical protein